MPDERNVFGRLNSWHLLGIVLVLALAVSAYLGYGVYKKTRSTYLKRIELSERQLAELRALDPDEPQRLLQEAETLDGKTKALEERLAAAGIEPLPEGADSVFVMQAEVSGALARHCLRVVSTAAKAAAKEGGTGAKPSARAAAASAKVERAMSAAEYEAEMMKFAGGLSGQDREMFLRDAKAKVAKMKRHEAEEAKKTARAPKAKPAAAKPAIVKPEVPTGFKTEDVAYSVEGAFKDIFLFFVAESHRKPAYNFRDIRVRPGEAGDGLMNLDFILQANWK